MRREVHKYLVDIEQSCELLVQFTTGKTLQDYSADSLLRSAVERQFEIVGEALRQALHLDPGLRALITDSDRIVAFRNRLIHGYASVSDEVVWGVVETNLLRLRREVNKLMNDLDRDRDTR